jgi:hypothetical protein
MEKTIKESEVDLDNSTTPHYKSKDSTLMPESLHEKPAASKVFNDNPNDK